MESEMKNGKRKSFDVFISYRRETGADDARLLQQALKARGYNVFFDYDSLRDGKFDETIFEAIDEAPVFVLLLTERALDRCVNADDWVRLEIERAVEKGKKIISVAPSDQRWGFPENLPDSLCTVRTEQASELNKASLFEESIDKIIDERFPCALKSVWKRRVSKSIPSTVSSPSPVFVGRDKELGKIHDLLAAGKIPVVTAPGGTGKSELVRQYAVKYRAEYPGGLFQIDMEKAGDWDDALNRLLTPASAPGVDVRGILDLKNKGGDGNKEGRSELQMEDVVGGLRRRGEQFGRILLVLDNVESTKVFLHESVISGLNLSSDIALVATARTSDIIFRKTDSAIELQLQDLSIGAAVELLLKDNPAETAAERKAAENIARLLGCRALHLRAVPALLNDPYSPYAGSYVELESELRKSFSETIDSAMEDYGEGARKPSALWEMTSKSLARHPHGQSWVRLAHVASFFSPEGFQKHVLRYLWGKLIAPDADSDLRFNQALEVLRRHGIISDYESELRIHRLTIAALRCSAREQDADIEDAIGKALALHGGMMPENWLSLSDSVRILHFMPDKIRLGKVDKVSMQVRILCSNPEYQEECHWNEFTSVDWRRLLCLQPRYADRCPWDKLKRNDWVLLLCRQPQFADHFPLNKFKGNEWAQLLESQPQFADFCNWEKLRSSDWVRLLESQPQFADHCPWEKLNWQACARLLARQPQLEVRYAWDKFSGSDWASLLHDYPRFQTHCLWWKLKGHDWASLLKYRPQFAIHCDWWKLDGEDWGALLNRHPQFADQCPWGKLSGSDWASLLGSGEGEQYADRCPWDKLSGSDWVSLLGSGEGEQYADRCPWNKLSGSDWASLLGSGEGEQYADRCPWDKLSGSDWASLLRGGEGEQYADRCPWDKLSGSDWVSLFSGWQWDAFDKCLDYIDPCIYDMYDDDNLWFMEENLRYVEHCPWEKLTGSDWVSLLSRCSKLADRCPWENLTGSDWVSLVSRRSKFADRCPWEKLTGSDWVSLLGGRRGERYADRCPWDKLSGSDWASLLGGWRGEQYAGRCPWEKLSGSDWASLLGGGEGEQYADRCPWDKLSGSDWASLLGNVECAQYADRCPWEELSGSDWVSLLRLSPEFAVRCLWKKIEINDWAVGLDFPLQLANSHMCHELEFFFKKMGALLALYKDDKTSSDLENALTELLMISRKLAERIPKIFNSHVTGCLVALAGLHEKNGLIEQSAEELSECVEIRRSDPELKKDYESTLLLVRLGTLWNVLNHVDKAEIAFSKALDLIKEFDQEMPALLGKLLVKIAGVHRNHEKYSQAECEYEETLRLCREMPGDCYDLISSALTGLGALHSMTGELGKAAAEFEEALAIREYYANQISEREEQLVDSEFEGGGTASQHEEALAETLYENGCLMIKLGKYKDAETMLARALEIRRRLAKERPRFLEKAVEETEFAIQKCRTERNK